MRSERSRALIRWLGLLTFLTALLAATAAGVENEPTALTPPQLVSRSPERGEALPVDGFVELVFDRAMDPRSVEAAFTADPCITGAFEWPDERTVRFLPLAPLARDAVHTITVTADAKDVFGYGLADEIRFRVTTVGFLEVSQRIPEEGSTGIDTDATITVIFNRPVVPLVLPSDPRSADLPDPLTFDPVVTGDGEWINSSIYVFTPATPMAGGTSYTVTVAGGLTDTTGGLLPEDGSWSFETELPRV
ncbi:MAG: Ig-like domain-containing protein, partial [Candidatus Bipolaricaulota bacterium]